MICSQFQRRDISFTRRAALFALAFGLVLFGAACQTPSTTPVTAENTVAPRLVLSAGDTLEITFPGATTLSGTRRIGPEGAIAMPIVGQVQAAGKSAQELERELVRLYENQLQDKQVIVTVAGSANAIYVMGAVARPGRVVMDRPLTALEAILEAGGFLETSNMKKVTVMRYEGERNVVYQLNLAPLYEGAPLSQFFLQPRDVVQVPAKIQWF